MKRWIALMLVGAMLCGGCKKQAVTPVVPLTPTVTVTPSSEYAVEYKESDTSAIVGDNVLHITFSDNGVAFDGAVTYATVNGNAVTVTAGGTYVVSGRCADGQIIVNEPKVETVRLVLDGLDLTSQSSAPIYVKEAKKVVLVLAEGSHNSVTDATTYTEVDSETNEPNAAIFSKGDLSVTGSGALTVTGQYNNGINSKDSLKITGGTVTVNAAGNGLKGKDCVAIQNGTVQITAGHDGIKSTNTADTTVGFVRLDGGDVTVTAAQDGIQAESGLVINGGTVKVTSGGGSGQENRGQWSGDTASAKALKAGVDILVNGGTVTVDSSDDAVHSNGNVNIQDGTMMLTSGDDGIHANNILRIGGGNVTVTKSYEGLEGVVIALHGGTVHVTAADDGVNAAGGNDGSSLGRPGENPFAVTEGALVEIAGGYTVLNADGDGLDSNNTIVMMGGTVLVYGPTNDGNGAIDYAVGFTISGGTLVACGASGMAESVTEGEGHAIFLRCRTQAAETPLCVTDDSGNAVITLVPPKAYGSAVIVTPQLVEGKTYTVTVGGNVSGGTVTDGVVNGGTCTAGSLSGEVTLSGVSTALNLGTVGGNFGGGPGGGMAPGGGGRPGGGMAPGGAPARLG